MNLRESQEHDQLWGVSKTRFHKFGNKVLVGPLRQIMVTDMRRTALVSQHLNLIYSSTLTKFICVGTVRGKNNIGVAPDAKPIGWHVKVR